MKNYSLSDVRCVFVLLIVFIIGCSSSDDGIINTINITIYDGNDNNTRHAIKLIKLAALKSGYKANIQNISNNLSVEEQRDALEHNIIDVLWSGTSIDLEKRFAPIRIPLYKGLLGYRVCLINSDDKDIMRDFNSLHDLRQLSYAQGIAWSDTKILSDAGLKVSSMPYGDLFKAVHSKEIDCVPLGIFEAFDSQYKQRYSYSLHIDVDKHILINYKMPFYFFTNTDNMNLNAILRYGLNKAVNDGSYDSALNENPDYKISIKKIRNGSRKIITLNNTDLSSKTPIGDQRLWFLP